jgi:hypothetical protein
MHQATVARIGARDTMGVSMIAGQSRGLQQVTSEEVKAGGKTIDIGKVWITDADRGRSKLDPGRSVQLSDR